MEINEATLALSALAQETRLRVFKLLVEFGSEGLPAGKISEDLKVPHNTLSFHLSHLNQAKLVSSDKKGRSIIYYANTKNMNKLISYLNENCCIRDNKGSC